MSTRHPRTFVAALGLALVLALTGCGGDEPAAEASGEPGSSSSTSVTSEPSEPGSPTTSPEPSVTPAAGPVLENRWLRMHAPAGFTAARELDMLVATHAPSGDRIYVSTIAGYDAPFGGSLDRMAQDDLRRLRGWMVSVRRVADVSLAGTPSYRVVGVVSRTPGRWLEQYGLFLGDTVVTIAFELSTTPETTRREIVDSVLASLAWKQ